jgi:hypothetical protein
MKEVTNYQKFLQVMRDPPRKLNIEIDDLLLNIYNNNPYTLYRRNEIVRLERTDPNINFNELLNKMWNNESVEIKEFYKILAIEGNRRFKWKYQQFLLSQLLPQPCEYYPPQQQLQQPSPLSYDYYQSQPQLSPPQLQPDEYQQLCQMPYEFYSSSPPQSPPYEHYEYCQPQQQYQHQPQLLSPVFQSEPQQLSQSLPLSMYQYPQPLQQEELPQPYEVCRSQPLPDDELQSNNEQTGLPYDLYFYDLN